MAVCLSYAGQTKGRVSATESKGVGEGYPSAPSQPRLRSTGDVVQVKLWLSAVQVEGRREHPVVASQGCKGCLQGTGGPQQMSRGPFSGGDGQAVEVLLEEPLDGGVFSSITQGCGGGVSVYVRYFCPRDAGVSQSCSHAPEQTGSIYIVNMYQLLICHASTRACLLSSPERSVSISRRCRDVTAVPREPITQNLSVDPGSSCHCVIHLL